MSTVIKDSPISKLSSLNSLSNEDLFLVSDKLNGEQWSSKKITYENVVNSLSNSLSSSMASVKLVTW